MHNRHVNFRITKLLNDSPNNSVKDKTVWLRGAGNNPCPNYHTLFATPRRWRPQLRQRPTPYANDLSDTPRLEAVKGIAESVRQFYNEVEWEVIHDAGCTMDDTELPHHVTSVPTLQRLLNSTFDSFLQVLPGKPTLVTISRSSEDDYCPPENVDFIENSVLGILRKHLSPLYVYLQYASESEEETHQ
ncbi:unnamed protein product [Bemisia tabaci]|uniref:Uncharacterized protein n=1 Tax=Bemisia tabaci TaxID=7038 RepID=A0A9P0EVG1_BEMTA|nr:unnamed protein product [Bemisia tabaci]